MPQKASMMEAFLNHLDKTQRITPLQRLTFECTLLTTVPEHCAKSMFDNPGPRVYRLNNS
jgi:hypothetical protein